MRVPKVKTLFWSSTFLNVGIYGIASFLSIALSPFNSSHNSLILSLSLFFFCVCNSPHIFWCHPTDVFVRSGLGGSRGASLSCAFHFFSFPSCSFSLLLVSAFVFQAGREGLCREETREAVKVSSGNLVRPWSRVIWQARYGIHFTKKERMRGKSEWEEIGGDWEGHWWSKKEMMNLNSNNCTITTAWCLF